MSIQSDAGDGVNYRSWGDEETFRETALLEAVPDGDEHWPSTIWRD